MSPDEHAAEAERLLDMAERWDGRANPIGADRAVAAAHVHALLAQRPVELPCELVSETTTTDACNELAVHEREAHNGDHDQGAGSSTGESGCDDTDVAGSSPAQPQPSDQQMCLCTHSRLEHRIMKDEPCRVPYCHCPAFRPASSDEGGDE